MTQPHSHSILFIGNGNFCYAAFGNGKKVQKEEVPIVHSSICHDRWRLDKWKKGKRGFAALSKIRCSRRPRRAFANTRVCRWSRGDKVEGYRWYCWHRAVRGAPTCGIEAQTKSRALVFSCSLRVYRHSKTNDGLRELATTPRPQEWFTQPDLLFLHVQPSYCPLSL